MGDGQRIRARIRRTVGNVWSITAKIRFEWEDLPFDGGFMSKQDAIIHLHFESYRYGEDIEVNSACGLGDYSERCFEHGTTDIKKVTCKNCLKSKRGQL